MLLYSASLSHFDKENDSNIDFLPGELIWLFDIVYCLSEKKGMMRSSEGRISNGEVRFRFHGRSRTHSSQFTLFERPYFSENEKDEMFC